ncbi:Lrp/AsnC family transcriptional regulator [Fusibacter ferrireducens]|uniref:Lrp/AsnC family transcriptional regulator n=1 Tax=Fusibacter ferrireducens TaxID=2785058 RepID=A0ABR9ZSS8_9FIRM|nr:Lrp/AsnC family transcriptional regulator [Fusibacter ferrireducens]MBF4693503.1 Lrp/AsnC family transcriptional regulator [Fusibacter ferrireducens]
MILDTVDEKLIALLRENAKLSYKILGEKVHMTGQAVGLRVKRLEDEGIIKRYTIDTSTKEMGTMIAYVTLTMKTQEHQKVKAFVMQHPEILEASRISGEGCYFLKCEFKNHEALNLFCDGVLQFANYRVNIATDRIK